MDTENRIMAVVEKFLNDHLDIAVGAYDEFLECGDRDHWEGYVTADNVYMALLKMRNLVYREFDKA